MSKNTAWGGRFSHGPKDIVAEYTESCSYDKKLYAHDIAGSKAHARMLARQGILSQNEAEAIVQGLDKVLAEIEAENFTWQTALEDVHMNIEARLTELVGDVGKKLHTGRSRNDQVGLAFRLYVSDSLRMWQNLMHKLVEVFVARAKEHENTILPGYTHLQPAQPVSLAQHLLAYAFMFKRDIERTKQAEQRVRISPLGAGALAGTTYPLDPSSVAKELEMYGIFNNSMDAVADRDFLAESLFIASCTMMHLSRFCEEIIIWANPAFGFIRLPDDYATGSSMMPQKKNPDVAELMRGKVGRVYGALMGMLTTLKGLPLTYNRDLQEDKEPFIDADKTLQNSLILMAGMLESLTFMPERMAKACKAGFLNATELADYLVLKGIPFREAHHLTGSAVALAETKSQGLEDLSLEELQSICPQIANDVYDILDYQAAVNRRETPGGTGPNSVKQQIKHLEHWLKQR